MNAVQIMTTDSGDVYAMRINSDGRVVSCSNELYYSDYDFAKSGDYDNVAEQVEWANERRDENPNYFKPLN